MKRKTKSSKKVKTIFLCASMNFYHKLVKIGEALEEKGFVVNHPVSA